MAYLFFLSYARGTIDDDVERFFRDLSAEVRELAGLPRTHEVGFLDRHSIELGSRWPQQLIRALSECSTFIALCSPRYFLSEACGKEWSVFEERLIRYEAEADRQAPMLIPLLWLPTKRIPQRAQVRQYENDRLDPAYRHDGLRQLIRLRMHRDAYFTAISVLARHIVDKAEEHHLPPHAGHTDFERIPNAFKSEGDTEADDAAATWGELRSAPKTSRYVHFVVAAPSRGEVRATRLRRDLIYYGEQRPDWAPYQPPTAIAESACEIATEHSFESGVTGIEGLTERMTFARANNQMMVILVDPWATKLSEHRRALLECDGWGVGEGDESPPSAVIVPNNHEDVETTANWMALSNDLRVVFTNRFARSDDRMFRPSVLSLQAFDADLRVALTVAQNRMLVHGTPHQQLPDDGGPPDLPMLGLPDFPN